MFVVLVVLTVALMVIVDLMLGSKARQSALGKVTSISDMLRKVPSGIFVQPTYTWSKIMDNGNIRLGIHPLLLGLVGSPDELVILNSNEEIEKGDPILQIKKGSRSFTITAPFAGKIEITNEAVASEVDWKTISKTWLYTIKPVSIAQEIPAWYIGENATEWVSQQYDSIRSFLSDKLTNGSALQSAADGGDIVVGVLAEVDDSVLKGFKKEFMV